MQKDKSISVKRPSKMPTSFSILLASIIIIGIITMIIAPYTNGAVRPARIDTILSAPIQGFMSAQGVCIFVLCLGGFLGIINELGALDAGINALVHKLHGRELLCIPILMLIFSLGGTVYGMCSETVPFYALLSATMMAAGFDPLVGSAIVLLGAGCGCLGSTINPFSVGAAVDALAASGVVVNQAIVIALGVILLIAVNILSIAYVMNYAMRVKEDKGSTFLSLREQQASSEKYATGCYGEESCTLTRSHKITLTLFALTFVLMITAFIPWESFGIEFWSIGKESEQFTITISSNDFEALESLQNVKSIEFDQPGELNITVTRMLSLGWSSFITGLPFGQWYFSEATTWLLIMSIVIGLFGGLSERRLVDVFVEGSKEMASVVMIIAVARGISVVMAYTGFDIYLLNQAAGLLSNVPPFIFAPLSYVFYFFLSFLIPSTSGMASVSMPIMGPLAVNLGFSPEVMIQIYDSAIGAVNLFTPTQGAIMGGLELAQVEWTTWIRFSWKLIAAIVVSSIVILTIAMMIL